MLKYIGNGFFLGVPARDLGDVEVKLLADALQRPSLAEDLVQSRLYEPVEAKAVINKRANKARLTETENE